jgi:ribosomal protein S18 acetylase RimI-like enzyme
MATATMEYQILPISPAHIAGYRRALDAVARERRYLTFLKAPPADQTRAFVMGNIAAGHPHFVGVAKDEVVGWCDIVRLTQPGFTHTGMLGMGVRREWRGRGVGKALLATVLETAAARELWRIELEVYADNAAARSLYRAHGFVEEGIKRDARCLDGACQDVVLMARLAA